MKELWRQPSDGPLNDYVHRLYQSSCHFTGCHVRSVPVAGQFRELTCRLATLGELRRELCMLTLVTSRSSSRAMYPKHVFRWYSIYLNCYLLKLILLKADISYKKYEHVFCTIITDLLRMCHRKSCENVFFCHVSISKSSRMCSDNHVITWGMRK